MISRWIIKLLNTIETSHIYFMKRWKIKRFLHTLYVNNTTNRNIFRLRGDEIFWQSTSKARIFAYSEMGYIYFRMYVCSLLRKISSLFKKMSDLVKMITISNSSLHFQLELSSFYFCIWRKIVKEIYCI